MHVLLQHMCSIKAGFEIGAGARSEKQKSSAMIVLGHTTTLECHDGMGDDDSLSFLQSWYVS